MKNRLAGMFGAMMLVGELLSSVAVATPLRVWETVEIALQATDRYESPWATATMGRSFSTSPTAATRGSPQS